MGQQTGMQEQGALGHGRASPQELPIARDRAPAGVGRPQLGEGHSRATGGCKAGPESLLVSSGLKPAVHSRRGCEAWTAARTHSQTEHLAAARAAREAGGRRQSPITSASGRGSFSPLLAAMPKRRQCGGSSSRATHSSRLASHTGRGGGRGGGLTRRRVGRRRAWHHGNGIQSQHAATTTTTTATTATAAIPATASACAASARAIIEGIISSAGKRHRVARWRWCEGKSSRGARGEYYQQIHARERRKCR